MRHILNIIRNFILFRVYKPWVIHGKNLHCQFDVEIQSPNKSIVIGDNVGINKRCVIISDVVIGNDVLIAPHCALLNRREHSFNFPGVTIFDGPRGASEKIVIRDDVWIGFGSIILSGIVVGEGAIIAAGSLVIYDVKPYTIVAGSPAQEIKTRFTDEEIIKHKKFLKERYNVPA